MCRQLGHFPDVWLSLSSNNRNGHVNHLGALISSKHLEAVRSKDTSEDESGVDAGLEEDGTGDDACLEADDGGCLLEDTGGGGIFWMEDVEDGG